MLLQTKIEALSNSLLQGGKQTIVVVRIRQMQVMTSATRPCYAWCFKAHVRKRDVKSGCTSCTQEE
jgi:hypothetical protein